MLRRIVAMDGASEIHALLNISFGDDFTSRCVAEILEATLREGMWPEGVMSVAKLATLQKGSHTQARHCAHPHVWQTREAGPRKAEVGGHTHGRPRSLGGTLCGLPEALLQSKAAGQAILARMWSCTGPMASAVLWGAVVSRHDACVAAIGSCGICTSSGRASFYTPKRPQRCSLLQSSDSSNHHVPHHPQPVGLRS